jgi:hypothetical protein
MELEFEFDSVAGIAIGVARGRITLAEMRAAAVSGWNQAGGANLRILWDLREAEFDLETDEVRKLAEFAKNSSPAISLRAAFVVSGDLEFGLIKMFQVFRGTETAQARVFRDKERAMEWLRTGIE